MTEPRRSAAGRGGRRTGLRSICGPAARRTALLATLAGAWLFVETGCATNRAPARVREQPADVDRTKPAEELIYPLLVHDPVIMLALLELALRQNGGDDAETDGAFAMVSPEIALSQAQLRTLPPELVTFLAAELIRARTSEPDWNEVHFGWGYFFGMIGLSPEATFELLNWWEDLEHTTWIGKTLGLSMEEGVFGYLWDLEHGMAGYAAGAAKLRGQ